ncbi:unnamed protein product [Euphydryas editha]|uniref:Pre-C2HC domain-containing protein n=1 Tax=Euphydryas editha TaxID=104508 RepID=A0AAU9UA46_EUPED|nr:unnamed protein product [Euphydryas editha]
MERFLKRSNSLGKRPHDFPTDTLQWEIPKRPARPAEANASVPTNTTNRFTPLETNKLLSDNPSKRHQDFTTVRKNTHKTPPIVIELKKEWSHEYIRVLISRYSATFHLQYRGNNKVAVCCYSPESHEAVKRGLKSENVPYHTFSRKDERTSKAVIFGLPAHVEPYLQEELNSLGFADVIVRKMKTLNGSNTTCPPFFVQLPPGSYIKRFKQIKYISKLCGNVDGRSWNEVAALNNQNHPTGTQFSDKDDQATLDMLTIFKAIKSIKNEFFACTNMMDRVILILTHLGQYV